MHIESATLKTCNASLVERVLHAARRVHEAHGPALGKTEFKPALERELARQGLRVSAVLRPARGHDALRGFRAELLVEDCLLLELAPDDLFGPTRISRIMTRPELSRFNRGYELNLRSVH